MDTLQDLATTINAKHHDLVRRTLESAREIGLLLLDAKRLVGHGNFQQWVDLNCKFGRRAAASYVRIARRWEQVKDAPTIHDALKMLAKPSQKPAAKTSTRKNRLPMPAPSQPVSPTDFMDALSTMLANLTPNWTPEELALVRSELWKLASFVLAPVEAAASLRKPRKRRGGDPSRN